MVITKWSIYVTAMTLCMSKCVEAFTSTANVKETTITSSRLFSVHKMISSNNSDESMRRREVLQSILSTSVSVCTLTSVPSRSIADEIEPDDIKARFTSSQIQKFLQPVDTFTIVDANGVPYMVVGEDAKLTAYFFTSFAEADRILQSAKSSATKAIKEAKDEENAKRKLRGEKPLTQDEANDVIGINPWVTAKISSVPLDFAAGLSLKGKVKGAFFRVAPSESDVEDAIEIDKIDELAEGKVPLFYFEDFEKKLAKGEVLWSDEGNTSSTKIPLFFSKSQLLKEWKSVYPKDEAPDVKVTELFSVLRSMVQGNDDDDLRKLVLVPPVESAAKAKQCLKGVSTPFKLGERIVVL